MTPLDPDTVTQTDWIQSAWLGYLKAMDRTSCRFLAPHLPPFLIQFILYWLSSLFFLFVDTTRTPTFIYRRRIQSRVPPAVSSSSSSCNRCNRFRISNENTIDYCQCYSPCYWSNIRRCVTNVISNQLLITLPCMVATEWILSRIPIPQSIYHAINTISEWVGTSHTKVGEMMDSFTFTSFYSFFSSSSSLTAVSVSGGTPPTVPIQLYLDHYFYTRLDPLLPSSFQFILEMIQCILWLEVWFYYVHYFFHSSLLYRFHKVHHSFTAPIAMSADYMHPLEFVGMLMAIQLSYLCTGAHVWTAGWFAAVANAGGTLTHSGYRVPWLKKNQENTWSDLNAYHDFHHQQPNSNLSFLGLMDWVHGTNEAWVQKWKERKVTAPVDGEETKKNMGKK